MGINASICATPSAEAAHHTYMRKDTTLDHSKRQNTHHAPAFSADELAGHAAWNMLRAILDDAKGAHALEAHHKHVRVVEATWG
eukprot:1142519-Pelagomonas_calceolata.AAC.1